MMANLLKHAANLAIASLDQRNFIPRIFGFLHQPDLGRSSMDGLHRSAVEMAVLRLSITITSLLIWPASNSYAPAQFGDVFFVGASADFYQISFGNMR